MKLLQRSVEIEPFQYQLNQQYSENDLHNLLVIRLQSLYITMQDDPAKFYETAWNLFDVNCKYFPTLANDPRNHKLYEMWDLTPRDDQVQHWRFVDSTERHQYIESRKKRFFEGKIIMNNDDIEFCKLSLIVLAITLLMITLLIGSELPRR